MKRLLLILSIAVSTLYSQQYVTKDKNGNVVISGKITIGTALLVPVVVSTSGPVSVSTWGFYFNNASGAITYTLPVITNATIGIQYCFRNSVGKSGAITLAAPASTFFDVSGTIGSSAGTLVSGGSLGDAACALSVDATHYYVYVSTGTWTNN